MIFAPASHHNLRFTPFAVCTAVQAWCDHKPSSLAAITKLLTLSGCRAVLPPPARFQIIADAPLITEGDSDGTHD